MGRGGQEHRVALAAVGGPQLLEPHNLRCACAVVVFCWLHSNLKAE